MVHIAKWKVILVIALCALGIVYAAPNLLGRQTVEHLQASLPSWAPTKTINLGLDLQGGSHLLLEVDVRSVVQERVNGLLDTARTELRQAQIGYTDLSADATGIGFTVRDAAQVDRARDLVRRTAAQDLETSVSDGSRVRVAYTDQAIQTWTRQAVDQSIEIVRRRIDETGTKEPAIQRQGQDRILVQLPGVDDPERVKRLLGQTAKLTFQMVNTEVGPAELMAGRVPPGSVRLPMAESPGQYLAVQRRVMVSGDTLTDAQPTFQDNQAVVSFRFDSVGARRFADATKENVGRPFAIVLDNKIISAPVIREPILGGAGVISGSFTVQTANDLALLLRAGALPAPLNVIEERTVGPGLGADSIEAGRIASIVGFVAVMALMIACYGLFGLFAVAALVINVVLIFALLSILQATLTLPGIAGIVLTMGMAVDANVLIYERIREEQRAGRSVISALDAGYSRAITTIWDSNLTTLIAAALLFILGSGPVRGFAVTLTIGIITSMFTAIMVTRLMVLAWMRRTKPKLVPI
ncbi:protein translocase subunit SecD [Azospirillum sp. RWY-5-1]|uniref:Protein translocase subunit SecD n=1 Tax=Azospirillum oleiclasticum TaxID=2735135 RepID=A0ABX2TBN0_9PROT|nr:protein translocase subunit SecD [Azospirillum oleiclasticum]NYZ14267.1 protein translocase subunit SecD [Azospirillum oleiclasticum]NYZ21752.1 protein translocase subunit SecD [Azospirillum oleiclasticum]